MNRHASGRAAMQVVLTAAVAIVTAAGDRFAGQTIFRSGVDLVEADAVVVDAQGRPVAGLTAADLQLSVDGRPREIESVEYIDMGGTPAASAADTLTANPGRTRQAQRHVVFVADEGSISAGGGRAAVQAAGQVLDRLGPSDRVALLSIPSGPAVDFTNDHEPVRAALARVTGRAVQAAAGGEFGLPLNELFAFDVGATPADRSTQESVLVSECPLTMPAGRREGCEASLRAEAQSRLDAIRERSQATLTGLDKLIRSLARMDGVKIIVLVSEGLLMRPDHRDEGVIHALGTQAALAGVTLHSVLLDPPAIDIAATAQRERPSSSSTATDRIVEEDGVRALAAVSGGLVIRASAAPDAGIRRLASALVGFYAVAFRALPSDREGPHQIRLVANNPALTVHARSQFVMTRPARPAVSDTSAADAVSRRNGPVSSLSIDKLTLRVATRAISDADGTVRILLSVDVREPAAHPVSALALGYKLTAGGRLVADSGRVVPVTHDADGTTQSISYIAFRGVPPGRYKLEMSASDGTKHVGFVAHPVEAALHQIGALRLSDLLLASSAPNDDGPFPIPATLVFTGSQIVVGVEATATDAAGFADAAIQFALVSPQGVPLASSAIIALSPSGATSQFVRATLQIPRDGPRDCLARASVLVNGTPVGRIDESFRTAR